MAVSASLDYTFGFHCGVNHGLLFHGNKELLFLAGQMCVLHDIENNEQKFFPISDLGTPTAIIKGPKNLLAIADLHPLPRVSLYDTESSFKLAFPQPEVNVREYICLCFSADFKFLAAQGGPPDWAMPVWIRDKHVLKTVYLPNDMQPEAEIMEIRFHPRDNDQLVAVGKQYFRLYKFEEEEGFKPFIFAKQEAEGAYLSTEWLPRERLAIGTSDGRILFFDGVEQRYEIAVRDKSHDKSFKKSSESLFADSEESSASVCVAVLITTRRGIFCTYGSQVVVEYVRTADGKGYIFKQSIHLPLKKITVQKELGEVKKNVESITDMKLSPSGELMAVCTDNGQLFYFSLIETENEYHVRQYFKAITQPVHTEPIIGIDTAVKLPLLASCAQNTLCLWDYLRRTRIMCKNFYDDILSVAIHPLGFHLVIGFTEYTRLFIILITGLREIALISTQDCHVVSFSHGGHLLAIANKSYVEVYNFITLEMITQLRGHHGNLTAIVWNHNDTIIVSCDDKGAIYVWDFIEKQRIAENVIKGTAYSDITISPDGKYMYAVGSDATIRELLGSDIIKEAPTEVELTALDLSHSGHMLFGGTKTGCLRTFLFPLTAAASSSDALAHLGQVTDLKIVFGDQYLITSGKDGVICIWKITDRTNKKKTIIEFSNAYLIDRDDLKRHFQNLQELQVELEEIQRDTEYQLELKGMFFDHQKRIVCGELEQKIASLNVEITKLSEENRLILSMHKENCVRIEEENRAVFDKVEESMRKKILDVYKSCEKHQGDNKTIEEFLQSRIEEIKVKSQQSVETLTKFYMKQIEAREKIIHNELQLMKKTDKHYQEIYNQLNEEAKSEIFKLEAALTNDIKLHQEEIQEIKEANEIAKKKIVEQQNDIQHLNEQIKTCIHEEARLKGFIVDLEKDKDDIHKVNEEKNCVIKELQENLYDIHQKKQNLEKHEFVLTSLLKSQVVEKEIVHGSKIIEKLHSKLEALKAIKKKREQEIDATLNRIKNLKKDQEKEKLKACVIISVFMCLSKNAVSCSCVQLFML